MGTACCSASRHPTVVDTNDDEETHFSASEFYQYVTPCMASPSVRSARSASQHWWPPVQDDIARPDTTTSSSSSPPVVVPMDDDVVQV